MQSEIADPFAVLGLSRTASADDLKRAYRKLSLAWHPDRHASKPEAERQEAERRFKLINAAYVAVGEILRGRDQGGPAAGTRATAEQPDARVEAIRAVVASAALRTIPHLPRHVYRRVVVMVEGLLLDTVALGNRAFVGGFDAAMREALEMAGLGHDSRADALKVLDAAADDLQWRGRGADPQTWQALLRPLEQARRPQGSAARSRVAAPNATLQDLLRPEPALLVSQGALAVLILLLLLPIVPLAGAVRLLLLLLDLALLGYLTFGPR